MSRVDHATREAVKNPFLLCVRCGKKTVCKLYRNGRYIRLCLECEPVELAPVVAPAPVVVVEEPQPEVVLERVTEKAVERVTERVTFRGKGPFHWQQGNSRSRKALP